MALNPIVFTEKVVRSFLRYQLTAYPFADEDLHTQMRELLSLDQKIVVSDCKKETLIIDYGMSEWHYSDCQKVNSAAPA